MTKRILISQPMRGKTKEQIEKEREPIVKALGEKGYYVMDSVFTTAPEVSNIPLWCLGMSFTLIADCDAVFFMDGWEEARGCRMEYEACKAYGIPIILQGV